MALMYPPCKDGERPQQHRVRATWGARCTRSPRPAWPWPSGPGLLVCKGGGEGHKQHPEQTTTNHYHHMSTHCTSIQPSSPNAGKTSSLCIVSWISNRTKSPLPHMHKDKPLSAAHNVTVELASLDTKKRGIHVHMTRCVSVHPGPDGPKFQNGSKTAPQCKRAHQ